MGYIGRISKLQPFNLLFRVRTIKVLVFAFVLGFTFILRAHNYERTPTANHLDEQLFAWAGLHLIETGVPISWSTLDYPESAEVFRGVISYKGGPPEASVTLYKPWLDQPPFFSLMVGAFARYFGADRNDFVPSSFIRFPVIFISTITSMFIFLIANRLGGYWSGILAMLVYGTTPIFVLGSRSAMSENLIAFLYVVIVYLLLLFRKSLSFYYLLPLPLLIGMAGLSKTTGFFLLPITLYLIISAMKLKKTGSKQILKYCAYVVLAVIPFLLVFYFYGNYYSPEVFKQITTIQANRPVGFSSLMWFFITPSLDTSILRDSWYVFCLLAAAFFVFVPGKGDKKIVTLAFIYWVGVIMVSGGENDLLAWYRFPVFPFLAILGAWGIEYLIKRPSLFAVFISVGFFLGNRTLLVTAHRSNISPLEYRAVVAILLSPSALYLLEKRKFLQKISKTIIGLLVVIGMYFNVVYIYNAYELNCESKTCPMVPSTSISGLHFPFIWRVFVLGEQDIYWCGDKICRD